MSTALHPCLFRLIVLASALATAGSGAAAETRPVPNDLPGVKGDYRIVKPPAPPPQSGSEQLPVETTDGWDVTVSGSLTIDTAAGHLPLPRN